MSVGMGESLPRFALRSSAGRESVNAIQGRLAGREPLINEYRTVIE